MGAYDLFTTEDLLDYLGMSTVDAAGNFLTVYHDNTGAPSAVTVAVSNNVLTLDVDGTPTTFDLTDASYNTVGELVTAINNVSGFVANALCHTSQDSSDLFNVSAASCLLAANVQTLQGAATYRLTRAIEAATEKIEGFIGHNVLSRSYSQERQSIRHARRGLCFLNQWPVSAISKIWLDVCSAITITNSDASLVEISVTNDGTTLNLATVDNDGSTSSDDLTLANYDTVQELATAISAVGSFSASAITDEIPASYLLQGGPWFLSGSSVELRAGYRTAAHWNLDSDRGILFLEFDDYFTNARREIIVSYTAGWSSAPADIRDVGLALAGAEYYSSKHDPTLIEQKLGDKTEKWGDRGSGAMASLSAHQKRTLGRYRRNRAV